MTGDLARAIDFTHAFARRRSPREIAVPGGFAVLNDHYPGSYDDNKLIVRAGDDLAPTQEAAERLPVLRRDWRRTLPEATDDVIDRLAARVEVRLRGADLVGFRGVRAPDGEIAARADLYVHDGVAQIESVFTAEEHRGKGYARALMTSLLAEATGAGLIFLLADATDWPKNFYAELGFEPLGHTHSFLRA